MQVYASKFYIFSKKLKVDAKYLKFVFSFKNKIWQTWNHMSQGVALRWRTKTWLQIE